MIDLLECPKCGRKMRYGKPSCFYCGASLKGLKPANKCHSCGKDNPDTCKFCQECGAPLEQQGEYVSIFSRMPHPPEDMNLEACSLRSITFSPEAMKLEKGYPATFSELHWSHITAVNVYQKIDEKITKIDKSASVGSKLMRTSTGMGVFQNTQKKSVELKHSQDVFVCEILSGNSREIVIGDKFNYGKTLGPEREYSLPNNFSKLVKKIVHNCGEISMNRGTELILSR